MGLERPGDQEGCAILTKENWLSLANFPEQQLQLTMPKTGSIYSLGLNASQLQVAVAFSALITCGLI